MSRPYDYLHEECPNADSFVLVGMEDEQKRDVIEEFLDEQPASYGSVWAKEDIFTLIEAGVLIPWIYVRDGIPLGLALLQIISYSKEVRSIKIEFLSCRNFFAITDMYSVLEHRAREGGFTMIEAIAAPTIAEYAVRKKGFAAPGVHICKTIQERN